MTTQDALKLFQTYLSELVEIGGKNLPKSISSGLGAKLAKIYKKKGINDIISGLRKSYQVLNGSPEFKEIEKDKWEIKINYSNHFCPIGGKKKSSRGNLIRESICIPYTIGFLNEMNSEYFYRLKSEECILETGDNICHYMLQRKRKQKDNNYKLGRRKRNKTIRES